MVEYNVIEGRLMVNINEETIQNILKDIEHVAEGIIKINQWAIPHWKEVKSVKTGAVSINKKTAESIIDCMLHVLPKQKQAILTTWVNYGWSINENLEDFVCVINFYKINYKTRKAN